MNLIPVTNERFGVVCGKMREAFPYEERREINDEKQCFLKKEFGLYEITENGEAIGFIALWLFKDFVFIEHLAVDSAERSKGYGKSCIEMVKNLYNKTIILEVEAPETEQQIKRVRFYERCGFKMNDFDYMQPSYHGGEAIPLKIMSSPEQLSEESFKDFYTKTRETVYNVNP